ncbi:hypothetical protein [Agromyces sp. Root81]|uniref:hypothetical protein n=1 Tax=Agromyces sp. Root81 TaxID=1736601 RepID=UPI001F229008|nr:hypothetical protein [Agromyces sp. Root81]
MTSQKFMSLMQLAILTVVAVASLRSLPAMAGYGLGSITLFIIPAIFFLVPTALVAAELATGWKGGVFTFILLVDMAAALYLIMYMMMFAAAMRLRTKQPHVVRSYRAAHLLRGAEAVMGPAHRRPQRPRAVGHRRLRASSTVTDDEGG